MTSSNSPVSAIVTAIDAMAAADAKESNSAYVAAYNVLVTAADGSLPGLEALNDVIKSRKWSTGDGLTRADFLDTLFGENSDKGGTENLRDVRALDRWNARKAKADRAVKLAQCLYALGLRHAHYDAGVKCFAVKRNELRAIVEASAPFKALDKKEQKSLELSRIWTDGKATDLVPLNGVTILATYNRKGAANTSAPFKFSTSANGLMQMGAIPTKRPNAGTKGAATVTVAAKVDGKNVKAEMSMTVLAAAMKGADDYTPSDKQAALYIVKHVNKAIATISQMISGKGAIADMKPGEREALATLAASIGSAFDKHTASVNAAKAKAAENGGNVTGVKAAA